MSVCLSALMHCTKLFQCNFVECLQIPGEQQADQLRRQVRDEVERPMRELLDAANADAERYRADYNRAARELVVVRAELDQLRTEHCRAVAELKMRLESEVRVRHIRATLKTLST